MASSNTAVFGIYHTAEQSERAVDALIAAGYSSEAISAPIRLRPYELRT